MNFSLRLRLVAVLVLLSAIGLVVANVSGVVLLRSYLYDRIDAQSQGGSGSAALPPAGLQSAADICSRLGHGPGPQLPSEIKLVVLAADGHHLCTVETSSTARPAVPRLTIAQAAARAGKSRTVGSLGVGGPRWRIRAQPLADGTGTLVTALSLAQTDATVRRLTLIGAATSLVVLLMIAAGGWFLVGLGLRPLTAIEATAEAIADGDLSQRVPPGRPGTEVGRLSRALNGMLAQIELAFSARAESESRLRRFIADASHELRTPLATIRGHAELYRQGAIGEPDIARLLGRIESEASRMGELVEDMLLLARLDHDRPLDSRRVDMLSLASDAVSDARAVDPTRRITLKRMTQPPFVEDEPVTRGDEARLRQVLGNLVMNALRHTPAGTPVEVRVGVQDGGAVPHVMVEVSDQGPGMPDEVATRVFERFFRADPSRSRKHGGTGLGLSIVAAVINAHHGEIECRTAPDTGTTFVITLPTASTSSTALRGHG